MNFLAQLDILVDRNNSLVCVGLDPDRSKLPEGVSSFYEFNKAIVDATHDLVCCYKPNSAFYEAEGTKGIEELRKTVEYIHTTYQIPVILDAKRADIGHTNEGYVSFAYDYLGVDAVTLQPYLGGEAIAPFLERADQGVIILCKTSNPGSDEFQDLMIEGEPLYIRVAERVVDEWNTHHNCLMVVGATYPEEMVAVRQVAGDMVFLVPGIGAQGGDVEKTVRAGLNRDRKGMIINSSRAIIYASSGKDYAARAREEALKLRDEINTYR